MFVGSPVVTGRHYRRAMALASLRFRGAQSAASNPLETKSGAYIYTGDALNYHEWQFRTNLRLQACEEKDVPGIVSKIVEGLRGDALHAAMEIGLEDIKTVKGVQRLMEIIHKRAFPLASSEAKNLLDQGNKPGGVMSRQAGESMVSYIDRRRRWWKMVKTMDDTVTILVLPIVLYICFSKLWQAKITFISIIYVTKVIYIYMLFAFFNHIYVTKQWTKAYICD